jgi:hypothetical protein
MEFFQWQIQALLVVEFVAILVPATRLRAVAEGFPTCHQYLKANTHH